MKKAEEGIQKSWDHDKLAEMQRLELTNLLQMEALGLCRGGHYFSPTDCREQQPRASSRGLKSTYPTDLKTGGEGANLDRGSAVETGAQLKTSSNPKVPSKTPLQSDIKTRKEGLDQVDNAATAARINRQKEREYMNAWTSNHLATYGRSCSISCVDKNPHYVPYFLLKSVAFNQIEGREMEKNAVSG